MIAVRPWNLCPDCRRDTDGLPPCDAYGPHNRPDGRYCDCGHDRSCHEENRT